MGEIAAREELMRLSYFEEPVFNGSIFLVRCPRISSQYIGAGRTKEEALWDAIDSIRRFQMLKEHQLELPLLN